MSFSTTASRRLSLFTSVSAIGLFSASLLTGAPAVACMPAMPVDGATVTCSDATYPTGISFMDVEDLTVVVNPAGPTTMISEGLDAGIAVTTSDPVNNGTLSVVVAPDAGETVTIATTSNGREGIKVYSRADDVYVFSNATINTSGDAIDNSPGGRASGIIALSRESQAVAINAGDITVTGASSTGMWVEGFSLAIASNYGTIDVAQSSGIFVEGEVQARGYNFGSVTVSGTSAIGMYVYGAETDEPGTEASLGYNAGTITTNATGGAAMFLYASLGTGTITNNGTLTTNSDGSYGVWIYGSSPFTNTPDGNPVFNVNNGGTINTVGANAYGISVYTSNGSVTVTNSDSIATTGANGDGVNIFVDTASVTVNNAAGSIMSTGVDADAVEIYTYGGQAATVNNAALLHGGTGSGAAVNGAIATPLIVNNMPGGTLSAESERFVLFGDVGDVLNNAGDAFGFFELGDGADSFNNLAGGQVFLTQISDAGLGMDEVDNRGSFLVDGTGMEAPEIQGLEVFRNFGSIVMNDTAVGGASAVAGDTLSISGDFVSEGGSLFLDTFLGTDASPSDVLILEDAFDGSAPTQIFITNTGGPGDLTTGDGILVVDTDISEGNVFTLGAPVYAGVYEYLLAQEGDDWFLQSRVAPQNEEYVGLGLQQMGFWYETLLPLHTRMGELRLHTANPNRYQVEPRDDDQTAMLGGTDLAIRPGAGDRSPYGVWVRAIGASYDVQASGVNWDQEIYGAQFAADMGIEEAFLDDDVLVLGAMLGLAGGKADFGMGSEASFDDYSVSLYANYFTAGLWATAVVKFDYLDVDWTSPILPDERETDGWSAGGLLEVGYTYVDESGGWFLEPQAEIAYVASNINDLDTGTGNDVAFEQVDSLRGRLGVRGGGLFEVGYNGRFSPYLQAHVLHEFLADSEATVAGVTYEADLGGTAYEVGAGVHAADLSSNVSVFADVVYRGGDVSGVRALGGIRFSW